MNLHDLKPAPGSRTKRKRIGFGLGSGSGKTAGKGHKGQKARAGVSISAVFEGGQMPLIRRTPKRGFSNFRHAKNYQHVNLKDLEDRFSANAEITIVELVQERLVRYSNAPVKILGEGDITKSFTVKANAFSAAAAKKIEAAGGKAEVI